MTQPIAVERLLAAAPEEQTLTRACAALLERKHGDSQPDWLKGRGLLRRLEAHGLAEYSETRGWMLTLAGKTRRRMFLEAGRAALRAMAKALR